MVSAQLAGGLDGVVIGHLYHFVDQRDIEDAGDEAIAYSLNLVEAGLVAQECGPVFWLDGDDFSVGFVLLEEFADALKSAAAADAGDEAVDLSTHLAP